MSEKQLYGQVAAAVEAITDKLIGVRRHLHMYPEIGRAEYKTSLFLQNKLLQAGPFSINKVGETGFYADIVRSRNAPWIALRADIDALPIQDEKKTEYRSRNKGFCHACGHDFHSSVVFGVAHVLQLFKKYLHCNVRLIFQHAEEPIPGGAQDFVAAGAVKKLSAIFGLHVDPQIPVNSLALRPGWISAQSIHIKLEIRGYGGHSSRPHEAADALFAGVSILNRLYSTLYRLQNPEQPFVFTIGKVTGGESYNSLARKFSAEGTLRVSEEAMGDPLLDLINNICKEECDRWQLASEVLWTKGAPPVVNDPVLCEEALNIFSEVLDRSQISSHERSMGGEDFSHYLKQTRGCFILVGVGGSAPLHSGNFDIDERALNFAVKAFSWLMLRYQSLKRK